MLILQAIKEWIDVLEMFIKVVMITLNIVKFIQGKNITVKKAKPKTNSSEKRKAFFNEFEIENHD